jgi:monovalent cation:H+ antiporter, CPA1 family
MDIVAVFLVITALMAYVNHRFIGLPTTIGVMSIALALSLSLVGLDHLGFSAFRDYEEPWLKSIDFSDVLLQGMLSLLLFAGALHVDLSELKSYRWPVGLLAIGGTLVSTVIVAAAAWFLLPQVGVTLPLAYCLAFGALISPTDPVAVMGILKSARVPKSLEVVISGESLFNDGVGVVLFALVVAMLRSGQPPTFGDGLSLLLLEAGGGILYGLALGYVSFVLLRSIDSYEEEVLITLATVVGGYALASHLHVSGPLAMVVVGLVIGNHGRALAMSDATRAHLDMFWELVDAILNSVLFVLIGMELILVDFSLVDALPALLIIAVTLLARLASVAAPIVLIPRIFDLPARSWQVLTWGGLRGGISVALALSLPLGAERDTVLTLTYSVVVFSILVQGLTIGALAKRVLGRRE